MERLGVSTSFVELAWISEEWKQSWNLLKPGSFDVCKKTVVPIIVMLGHSEVDIEVLDIGMETIESNDYREVLGDDRDTSSMLTTI